MAEADRPSTTTKWKPVKAGGGRRPPPPRWQWEAEWPAYTAASPKPSLLSTYGKRPLKFFTETSSALSKSASAPQSLRMTDDRYAEVLDQSRMGLGTVLFSPLSDSASHLARTGMVSLHRKDMDTTFSCFDEAVNLSPDFSGAYRHRAHAHLQCGETQEAVEDLSTVLNADTTMSSDWNDRAAARESLGDHLGAIQDSSEAIARNTYLTPAWSRRGLAKLHLKEYAAAEEDYAQAIYLDPNDAENWRNRGLTRLGMGSTIAAEEDLSKAIKLHPSSNNYLTRAEARLGIEDFAGSVRDSTQAIKHEDLKVDAWHCRAVAKKKSGDLTGARSDCTEAIRRTPYYVQAWELRAEVHCLLGDWVAVVDDCNEAIRLRSAGAMMWCYRGKAHFQRGQYLSAIFDYECALKRDPNCELARQMLVKSRKSNDHLASWKLASVTSLGNYVALETLQFSKSRSLTEWAALSRHGSKDA